MPPTLTVLFGMLRAALLDRQKLMLENAALRQQIIVLRRSVSRPRLEDSDRAFFVLIHRLLADWKSCLLIVKPETVIRWAPQGRGLVLGAQIPHGQARRAGDRLEAGPARPAPLGRKPDLGRAPHP